MPRSIELPVDYRPSKLRFFLIPKEHLLQRLEAAVNVSLPIDHPTRIHGEKSTEIVSWLATNAFIKIPPSGIHAEISRALGIVFWRVFGGIEPGVGY